MSLIASSKRPASEALEEEGNTSESKIWIVNLINEVGDFELVSVEDALDNPEIGSDFQCVPDDNDEKVILLDDKSYRNYAPSYFKEPKSKSKRSKNSGWNAAKNRDLKFLKAWYEDYPFLEYDEKNNVMYCKVCRKFVNDWRRTSPFVIGTNNFRISMIKYHRKSGMHAESQELADTLIAQDSNAMEKDLYKDQLSHVFKSVYFIYKNKMPYTSFPQLCESQKREGTDFAVYSTHIKACTLFGKFIGMAYEKELALKIADISEFALVIDASFKRNIESHDLVYIKYIEGLVVKTIFLGVIDSSAKLHDSLCDTLSDLFKQYDIYNWFDKVVYIMTDKSDNHLWLEGLINIIDDMPPKNFISEVKYLPHKVRYCSNVVASHPSTSTLDALLWSIYCYYEKVDNGKKNLVHMNQELEEIIALYGNLPKNSYTTLYYESLKAIEQNWATLVSLIIEENQLLKHNFKTRKVGNRIINVITRSSFILKMAVLLDIFSFLKDFANALENLNLLPYDIHILLEEVCSNIETAANGNGKMTVQILNELTEFPGYFRNIEIKDDSHVPHCLLEMKNFGDDLICYLRSLIDDTLLEKSFIFNVNLWPEDDLSSFGDSEFIDIFLCFKGKGNQVENALSEWTLFKQKVSTIFPSEVRQDSRSVIAKMVAESEKHFPLVISVLRKILLLNFDVAEIKRGYHEMCLNKSHYRSMLSCQSLQTMMMINMYGPSLGEFDFSLALNLFLNSRPRKFRKKIIDNKINLGFSSEDDDVNNNSE